MRIVFCCLLAASLVGGCAKPSPEHQLIDRLGTATSWVATLDLASESWLGNRVPESFMNNTLDAAQQSFDDALQSVDASEASASLRQRAREQFRAAEDAAGELRGAVHRGDAQAARRARARLVSAHAALQALESEHER